MPAGARATRKNFCTAGLLLRQGAFMDKCSVCKTEETELYENGVAVCLQCVKRREEKSFKEIKAIAHAELARRLMEATLEAESATVEIQRNHQRRSQLYSATGRRAENSQCLTGTKCRP
jgi:hypothetical protein